MTLEAWEAEFDKYKESPEYKWKHTDITLEDFKFIWWMEYSHQNTSGNTLTSPWRTSSSFGGWSMVTECGVEPLAPATTFQPRSCGPRECSLRHSRSGWLSGASSCSVRASWDGTWSSRAWTTKTLKK